MSAPGADVLRGLPADVAQALEEFVTAAREALGDALQSVVLYGSGAGGGLRATPDVTVIPVLRAFGRGSPARLREPLRVAHATIGLKAMFLLREEMGAAAE